MMNNPADNTMTMGNHEFDDGPKVLRCFMDALACPVLMPNADVTQEGLVAKTGPEWFDPTRHE
ncbi:MAG: hypothetical protein ABJ360_02010 [Roseobacter sp.]